MGLACEALLYESRQFTVDSFWIFDVEIVHFAVRFGVLVYSLQYVVRIWGLCLLGRR